MSVAPVHPALSFPDQTSGLCDVDHTTKRGRRHEDAPDNARAAICAAAGEPYTPAPTITDRDRAAGEAAFDAL